MIEPKPQTIKHERGDSKSTKPCIKDYMNYALKDTLDEDTLEIKSKNEFEYNEVTPSISTNNEDLPGIKNVDGKYPCDECDYQADAPAFLKRHKQAKHEGVILDCLFCDQSFSFRSSLIRHQKRIHTKLDSI